MVHKNGCGCGPNCGCGHGGKRDTGCRCGPVCGCGTTVGKAYNVKGQNFLSPKNKTLADGFWTAGQSVKSVKGVKYGKKK